MSLIGKLRTGARAVATMVSQDPARAAAATQKLLSYHLARMSHDERRRYVESKPRLDHDLMREARLFPDRETMLNALPQGGVVGEVGSDTGYFSIKIAETNCPAELHLFDIDFGPLREEPLCAALGTAALRKHLGDSSSNLGALRAESFDWIYIDGDHHYDGVVRDLAAADRALKPGGFIMCNDYTVWAPMEAQPYGVPRAINEFLLRTRYQIIGYAFHLAGHDDILLRKPGGEARPA